jgi:hypothetical protein
MARLIERVLWFIESAAPCTCNWGWCLGAWAMKRIDPLPRSGTGADRPRG